MGGREVQCRRVSLGPSTMSRAAGGRSPLSGARRQQRPEQQGARLHSRLTGTWWKARSCTSLFRMVAKSAGGQAEGERGRREQRATGLCVGGASDEPIDGRTQAECSPRPTHIVSSSPAAAVTCAARCSPFRAGPCRARLQRRVSRWGVGESAGRSCGSWGKRGAKHQACDSVLVKSRPLLTQVCLKHILQVLAGADDLQREASKAGRATSSALGRPAAHEAASAAPAQLPPSLCAVLTSS